MNFSFESMIFVTGLAQTKVYRQLFKETMLFVVFRGTNFLDYGFEIANETVSNLAMTTGGFGEILKNRSEKTGVVTCYRPLIARFLFALLDTMRLHSSFHRFLYVFSRLFSRNSRSCRISHFHHRDHPPTKPTFTFANSLQPLFNMMQTTRLQHPMLDHPM